MQIPVYSQNCIKNKISYEKWWQCPTFPHSHPKDSYNCPNSFSLNICFQHWILGFLKGTTVRALLASVLECGQQDTSSDVQQNEHHLVRSLGCVVDARGVPFQIVTVRLPSVGLCGDLAPSNFSFCRPSEDASWWSQTPNIVVVPTGTRKQFLSQSTKFCDNGVH
jgi:hypothetical protein